MTTIKKRFRIGLQFFGEGGASAGGTAGGVTGDGAETGVTAGAAVPQTTGVKTNPLANVRYGKQEGEAQSAAGTAQGEGAPQVEADDRSAAFEKMIKGEYKDLYDARVQETVQKRLKGANEVKAKYEALAPVREMLGRKYGVDPEDTDKLLKAIEEDDAYYEDEALEMGVSVEQLKSIKKMERENAELKRQAAEREQKERVERDIASWMAQEAEAKKTYPGLSLSEELRNPQFVGMLKSGVDVGTAYFALHNKELVPQAMTFTAKKIEEKISKGIASGAGRPTENGLSGNATAIVKNDVTQLTRADREEIIRRVARGERISF